MTCISISWNLMAGNEIKLLWNKNQVLQVVGLKRGIQRQPIVLHRFCFGILSINWRLHVQNSTVFFFITQKTGNAIMLFKKKKKELLLRIWSSSDQAALLAACLGLPQRNTTASPPCIRNCPTSSCRDTAPQPPRAEMGIKNMLRPLQEVFCFEYTVTSFQYKS